MMRSPTPPMGWNSYNAYGCEHIDEWKVKLNAQGLIDKQLKDLGYTLVTPDCAWNSMTRDAQGKMIWNASTFPSGGKALGDYLHTNGLKFGMYSGGGHLQCNPWPITGSLGFEDADAQSFAEWGADSLKYDNCYAVNDKDMNNGDPEFANPARFQKMADSLNKVSRAIQYFVCQWGTGDNVGDWYVAFHLTRALLTKNQGIEDCEHLENQRRHREEMGQHLADYESSGTIRSQRRTWSFSRHGYAHVCQSLLCSRPFEYEVTNCIALDWVPLRQKKRDFTSRCGPSTSLH
jgi:hypothetical protein